MLVATFGAATGWAGKTITREGDVFVLEGHGPITAADVMEYDRQGHLVWATEGTRALVGSLVSSSNSANRVDGPSAVSFPYARFLGFEPRVKSGVGQSGEDVLWFTEDCIGIADKAGQWRTDALFEMAAVTAVEVSARDVKKTGGDVAASLTVDGQGRYYSRFQVLCAERPAWAQPALRGKTHFNFDGRCFCRYGETGEACLLPSWRAPRYGWVHEPGCDCGLCASASEKESASTAEERCA